MKKNMLFRLPVFFLLLIAGCAPVLVGFGALGGYMISEDELEGIYTIKKDDIFKTCKEVALDWSTEVLEDEYQTEIIATSESRRIWIRADQLTPDTTRLRVKARRFGVRGIRKVNTYTIPDIKTAQFIFERIVTPIHQQEKTAPAPNEKL